MALNDIVKVEITRENSTVTRKGFGVLLILTGDKIPTGEKVKIYKNMTEVADDFDSADKAYLMAQKALSGNVTPEEIMIGSQTRTDIPATAGTAQGTAVSDIATWTAIADGSLGVTMDGTLQDLTALDFSGETDLDGIASVIQTAMTSGTVVNSNGTFIFSSDTTGASSTMVLSNGSGGTDLYETQITGITATTGTDLIPAETPSDALDGIRAINDDWYALGSDLVDPVEIMELATYIQPLRKMYFTQSTDRDIIEAGDLDIASQLKEAGMTRTSIIYEATEQYSGIAWAGQFLPYNPGTINWAHKTLQSVTVSKLTGSEQGIAQDKLCNTYTTTAGRNTTQFGFTSELGTYIDIIRSIDWLEARMQENIFGRLVATLKIPYNESGFAIIASEVEAVLQIAENDVIVNPGWFVTVPRLADIPQGDKDIRHFSGTEFTAVLAGGVNTVTIKGIIR